MDIFLFDKFFSIWYIYGMSYSNSFKWCDCLIANRRAPTQQSWIAERQIKAEGDIFVHYLLLYSMFQGLYYSSSLNNAGLIWAWYTTIDHARWIIYWFWNHTVSTKLVWLATYIVWTNDLLLGFEMNCPIFGKCYFEACQYSIFFFG